MTRVSLRAALDLLPRYTTPTGPWVPEGTRAMTCARYCPKRLERLVKRLMNEVDYNSHIELVDVSGSNILVLHAALWIKGLKFFARNWNWQRWPRGKLPVYIKFRGKLIIWNGTHRMTIARLCGRKVRARVYDFDAFVKKKKRAA